MRFEDLPADLRRRALEEAGAPPKRERGRREAGGRQVARCQCGEMLVGETAAARHNKATGHGRFELVQDY